MARVSRLWTLCPLLLFVGTSLCEHFIREKGAKATFSCGFKTYEPNTTLHQMRVGHDFINVTSCTFGQNTCVKRIPRQHQVGVENREDGFTSRLIINNVRINETEFRCVSGDDVATMTLEVYARPSKPLCEPVELDYTKHNLQFRCRAMNVFPSVSASLHIRGEDTLSGHCSNDESVPLTLDGFSAECVWRMSAAKLEPIKYKYYVKMFPELSNSTGIDVPNAVSQDYTLQLSHPIAIIDSTHCPAGPGVVDGKIITGSTASCRCVLESPGFPPGQARWYTLHGNQSLGRDDTVDGSSTLEIYNNNPGQGYQCRAESPLKNPLNWGPIYTPVFTSIPVAVIDSTHCPVGPGVVDGKIITGSAASCRCVLESRGFPPGQARWYTLHGNQSLGRDNTMDGSSTLDIYTHTSTPGQSYQCRAESPLKNSLNWGPVYTPVFTTPSSGPETYSLRIEIVAGIMAGSVGLTVVIAVVVWKWRCRKRQNANTTSVIYNRPCEDEDSDYIKPVYSGDYDTVSF